MQEITKDSYQMTFSILGKDAGKGSSPLRAFQFMIGVDGVIVNPNVTTFKTALATMFAMVFNLNCQYHPKLSATMDLFQRTFLRIDPESGSKSSKKRHTQGVSPSVLTFFREYGNYDLCN